MRTFVFGGAIVRNGSCAVLLILLPFFIPAVAQSSGQYEINWHTIDGGGGRSSGGQYSHLGTIGQPDAAWSSGGDYELLGGFLPGGPLCFVNFEHFARFAQYWLEPGTGLPADLDQLNGVNGVDLRLFVEEWLCYCPVGWPLK
jgi:hypothetical protein